MTTNQPDPATNDDRHHTTGLVRVAAVWVCASVALFLALRPGMSLALYWDEVDYVMAARQGVVANATDRTALTPRDFIAFVRAKWLGQVPGVSPDYAETSDVFLLRHTHPPLLQYALAVLGPERLVPGQERAQRFVQFAGGAALIGTMLWGYRRMAARPGTEGMIAVAASGFLCAYYLSRDLNCHLWIAVTLVPVCVAVGRFMHKPAPGAGLIAGMTLGLAFLGLQTGLFAAFWAVVAVGFRTLTRPAADESLPGPGLRRRVASWLGLSAWMVAGFFAFLMVSYPGAIFRLSLVRIFALYAYLIIRGSEYAAVQNILNQLLPLMLPLILLGIAGIAWVVARRDPFARDTVVATAIIGTGYGLIMQKFLLNITYMTPALALLSLLGCVAISSAASKPVQRIAAALMAGSAAVIVSAFPIPTMAKHTVAEIQAAGDRIDTRRAWINGGHIMRYYCPEIEAKIGDIIIGERGQSITRRDPATLTYVPIIGDELAGTIVILSAFNVHPPILWEETQLPQGTQRIDFPLSNARVYRMPENIAPPTLPPAPPDASAEREPIRSDDDTP